MAYSVDSAVLIEAPPSAINSEVHVQAGDFSSGEAAAALEDPPQEPDLKAYPDAMVLKENPAVFAPALRKADAVQTRASVSASPLHNPQWHARFTHATISLFQAWGRSFSADAHSTWRQLRRLLRAQVLKVRPYARESR
jgi:hypothetical protein